jgi:peptide-methionine (R)-S-oxide reductase
MSTSNSRQRQLRPILHRNDKSQQVSYIIAHISRRYAQRQSVIQVIKWVTVSVGLPSKIRLCSGSKDIVRLFGIHSCCVQRNCSSMACPNTGLSATKLLVALSIFVLTAFTDWLPTSAAFGHNPSCRQKRHTMCGTKKDEIETSNDVDASAGIKQLTWNPLRLSVLRLGLTEPAMTSPLNYGQYNGIFNCAYCGQVLFDSSAKYDSGTGWPSFWRTAGLDSVKYKRELNGSLECQCQRCSSHLGHVFLDGPRPSTVAADVLAGKPASDPERSDGQYLPRYCMNGAALTYTPRETSA